MASSRYQTGGSEDAPALVVHVAPERVLNTDQYKTWMGRWDLSGGRSCEETSPFDPWVRFLQVSILD